MKNNPSKKEKNEIFSFLSNSFLFLISLLEPFDKKNMKKSP